jgi:hypothetical protein
MAKHTSSPTDSRTLSNSPGEPWPLPGRAANAHRRRGPSAAPRRPLPPRPRQLYRRTDKREQAQEHLTTARTMYREIDMTYWLEKAETEMMKLTG